MKLLIILATIFTISASCFNSNVPNSDAKPVSHDAWTTLLKKYVNTNGMVNYKAFQKDSVALNKYLEMLSKNTPNEKTWTKDEQLAYWINAYNAFTVQLILRNYPLKSIKDIVKVNITYINSPWDIKFINLMGKKFDLNDIENGIIRKKFDEPRIHFALVCAAISCPKLRNEAFTATALDEQLTDQAIDFLNDNKKNVVSAKGANLSSIFDWYKGDFTKKMSLQAFVNQYAKVKIPTDGKIQFVNYNWGLNGL